MDRAGKEPGRGSHRLRWEQMRILAILLRADYVCAVAQTVQPRAAQTSVAAPGSNMPADFYPHSPCVKPQKVRKDSTGSHVRRQAPSPGRRWSTRSVEQFNRTRHRLHMSAIRLYVDNARLDTQHILDSGERGCRAAAEHAIPSRRQWRQSAGRFLSATAPHSAGAARRRAQRGTGGGRYAGAVPSKPCRMTRT